LIFCQVQEKTFKGLVDKFHNSISIATVFFYR